MDGDAKKTPEILYDTVSSLMPARSGRTSEHAQQQPLVGFVGAIRNAVPDDGILISGMTQVRTDAVSVLRGFRSGYPALQGYGREGRTETQGKRSA